MLFVALVLLPPTNERQVPLTVYSAEPGGGKALRLWLEALGHPVTTLEGGRYAIGRDVRVVLLLAPTQRISLEVVGELERWTRQGGRLVVATDSILTWELLRRFGVSTRVTDRIVRAVPAEAGLLDPAIESVAVDTRLALSLDEDAASARMPLLLGKHADSPGPPLLAGTRGPSADAPIVAARVPADRGELIVLTAPAVLSNERPAHRGERPAGALADRPGPARAGRLRRASPRLRRRSSSAACSSSCSNRPGDARSSWPAAWCCCSCSGAVGGSGGPVPVFVDRGRSLGELVTSQAGLYRAGGKRAFVAEHLARQLRHDLAQVVGLPADATDAEIETRARAIGRDPTRALQALAGTRQARSDRELLAITREGERAAGGAEPGRPRPTQLRAR